MKRKYEIIEKGVGGIVEKDFGYIAPRKPIQGDISGGEQSGRPIVIGDGGTVI